MAVKKNLDTSSTAAELGRNPVISKHHIHPEYGDVQADAGRDCRTCLARPNSQARTERGQGNIHFPCSADHKQDRRNLTRLIHTTLAICMCDHILYFVLRDKSTVYY